MKTKVLLINSVASGQGCVPVDNYFPLGLLYISSELKADDIDARIIDIHNSFYRKECDFNKISDYMERNVYPVIMEYDPRVIGIGCIFSAAFKYAKVIAAGIKERFPEIPIVIGGAHPTIFAGDILKRYKYIDYVIIGEGEISFTALVKILAENGNGYHEIDGLAFRRGDDVVVNPKKEFMNDLDRLSHPDYEAIDVADYHNMDTSKWYSPRGIRVGQPFPILSSRSCPNLCTFCCVRLIHGPKCRQRSADDALDEMENLYKKYNVRYFQFLDDNLIFSKKRMMEICRGITDRGMKIQFDTPNGLSLMKMDQELIDAMVGAGMVRVCLAIESGSEYIRNDILKKNLSTEKIKKVVYSCARHNNLFISAFFVIGAPQETDKTLNETYEMMKDLPFDKFTAPFMTPYPGTEIFDYCVKHNLLSYKKEDCVDVECFHHAADRPHFKPHGLEMEDLIVFQNKCRELLKQKRRSSPALPDNYPLRYQGVCKNG